MTGRYRKTSSTVFLILAGAVYVGLFFWVMNPVTHGHQFPNHPALRSFGAFMLAAAAGVFNWERMS